MGWTGRTADYECKECGKTDSRQAEMGKGFPDEVVNEDSCPNKKSNCKLNRIWSVPSIEIAQGRLGNAANGYSKSIAYSPAPSTPLNKVQNWNSGSTDI